MPGDKMVSVDWLGTFSTTGVGQSFHCVRPGVLGVYGYSSDEKAGLYHATETLYVPHGVIWQRWKESNYTVGINAPDAPLGKRARASTCR